MVLDHASKVLGLKEFKRAFYAPQGAFKMCILIHGTTISFETFTLWFQKRDKEKKTTRKWS